MNRLIALLALVLLSGNLKACPETLSFNKRVLAGDEVVNLCERYTGKVLLVVNTASKCAYTPQYDGLEALYRKYKDQGLEVLGFPSNDFGAQEPGTEKQVQDFCRVGVTRLRLKRRHGPVQRSAIADDVHSGEDDATVEVLPRIVLRQVLATRSVPAVVDIEFTVGVAAEVTAQGADAPFVEGLEG